jgi:hypothetical protein
MKKLIDSPWFWVAIVISVWVTSYPIIKYFLFWCLPDSGQFGDTFGAINALFSGLAFAGVIYTLRLQQREIESSSTILHRERFESTFFKMLELQNAITSQFTITDPPIRSDQILNTRTSHSIYEGKAVFVKELQDMKTAFHAYVSSQPVLFNSKEQYAKAYEIYDERTNHSYDNYLTNVQLIYEFIMNHEHLTPDEKFFYLRMFALQLSERELVFFFYYYTLSEGKTINDNRGLLALNSDLDIMRFINKDILLDKNHYKFYDTDYHTK